MIFIILIKRSPMDTINKTLNSYKKIDPFPVYIMKYYYDYKFSSFCNNIPFDEQQSLQFFMYHLCKEVLNVDPQILNPIPPQSVGCTTYVSQNQDGDYIFGRNFDWEKHPFLILLTYPEDGYSSVSMVDLSILQYLPFQDEKQRLLLTPYFPFDGMNEHGLTIAHLAVPHAQAPMIKSNGSLGNMAAIRLVLDKAKNVDEAVNLLKKYNIIQGNMPGHFFIADSDGNSAGVEFVNNKIYRITKKKNWQVLTNFIVASDKKEGFGQDRYKKAVKLLKEKNGVLNEMESFQLLHNVSLYEKDYAQWSTLWSMVYNMSKRELKMTVGRNFKKKYSLSLKK